MTRRSLAASLAASLVLTLGVAGCGSDSDNGGSAPTTTRPADAPAAAGFPLTVEAANGSVTFDDAPSKIVVLSPALTEIVYAVGAGDQVVAVDDQSNFPEGVPTTALSGYEPNVEAISNYEPDLVLASGDNGDLVAGLEKIGITTLILPAATDLDDNYRQIELVGDVTGRSDEADDLVDEMKTQMKDLEAEVPDGPAVTYFHELDQTLYSVTSKSFIGELYALAGFDNIADEADPEGSGYPQLSAEYIIEQDPQAIFLADTKCCAQTRDTLAARPGWGNLRAVTEGHVYELDDDVASRWGPRVVDLFEILVDARVAIDQEG